MKRFAAPGAQPGTRKETPKCCAHGFFQRNYILLHTPFFLKRREHERGERIKGRGKREKKEGGKGGRGGGRWTNGMGVMGDDRGG